MSRKGDMTSSSESLLHARFVPSTPGMPVCVMQKGSKLCGSNALLNALSSWNVWHRLDSIFWSGPLTLRTHHTPGSFLPFQV